MNKTLLMLSLLALSTDAIGLTAYADDALSGMDMSSMKTAQKPTSTVPLSVTATVNPAAPRTGDNTLNLMISDATGKPVTGLKLTTSIAMTSMDMGTTHPSFTETGGGHYTAKVNFGMDGLWRVVIRNQGNKIAVLDFEAGAKTLWKSPLIKAANITPTHTAAPAANTMPGMDMSGGKPSDKKADDKSADTSGSMAGMDMGGAPVKPADNSAGSASDMAGMDMSNTKPMKMTGIADMKTATIPQLQETGTYTATGDEDWKKQTGFGHNAPMVGMMNQMMVGGSGMEGMKMAPMNMKFGEQNYSKPDASDADTGDSMAGMDMGGQTNPSATSKPGTSKPGDMAGMNMAASSPAAKQDAAPSAANAMPGMDMPAAGDSAPVSAAAMRITAVTASAPKAGDNPLTISVTDAQGKPITGATITTSVAMTSMDMGTSHPAVTEKGGGQYATVVNFSMAGPWRVKVKVTLLGQNPQLKAFDFSAR